VSGNKRLKSEINENMRLLLLLSSKGSTLATEGPTPDT
jgi:hypothetical protein